MNAELCTPSLHLRLLKRSDAKVIQKLVSDIRVSKYTTIPYPYPRNGAKDYLDIVAKQYEERTSFTWAIEVAGEHHLIGCIGIGNDPVHLQAEAGYWLSPDHWGKGYATEALQAIIEFGFTELRLNRISTGVFAGNEASVRVQEKCGLTLEGTLRQSYIKDGTPIDVTIRSILRTEWEAKMLL